MNSTSEDTSFVKDTLPYWSDGISFLLLGLMYAVLPTPPTRRLWERAGETVLWGSIVLSNLVWNGYRFFMEAYYQKQGPRGFGQMGVVYAIVWTYIILFGWKEDVVLYRRRTKVVDALKLIQTIRSGSSSRPKVGSNFGYDRGDQREVVVRRGVSRALWPSLAARIADKLRKGPTVQENGAAETVQATACFTYGLFGCLFPASRGRGYKYWRGTETRIKRIEHMQNKRIVWHVELEEEDLHREILEPFLRPTNEKTQLDLYQAIYEVTYLACRQNPDDGALDRIAGRREARRVEHMARRADCVDKTLLGHVARHIAGNACHYVYYGGEFRTDWQVTELNRIVNEIAEAKVQQHLSVPL